MAFARVQGTSTSSTTTSTNLAYTSNVTAGSLLICAVRLGVTADTATVSDNNGNTWHRIASDTEASDAIDGWYAANANAGATTVTVVAGVAGHTTRFVIEEYSGVATTTPLDVSGHTNSSGGTAASSVTTTGVTTGANELVVCAIELAAADTLVAGSGMVLGTVEPVGAGLNRIGTEWLTNGASGSTVTGGFSWTTNGPYATWIATFKAASAVAFTWQQLSDSAPFPPEYQLRPDVVGY